MTFTTPVNPVPDLASPLNSLAMPCPRGLKGLHFHTLFEADSFALEKVLAVFLEKFGKFLPKLKWVNMGGGHLMTKKDYDIAIWLNS